MRQALALKALVVAGAVALLASIASSPADAAQPAAPRVTGSTAYVLTESSLVRVDLPTRRLSAPLALPSRPIRFVISSDGGTGWALLRSADDAGTLLRVDLRSWTLGATVSVGAVPFGLALSPDGTTLYVTSTSGGMRPVDPSTLTLGAPIALGDGVEPQGLAITPDGRTAVVTGGCDPPYVYLVDLVTRALRRTIDVSAAGYVCPNDAAVAPDGRTAYSTGGYLFNGLVPIDLVTEAAQPEIPMQVSSSNSPQVTPDSRTAFVSADGAAIVDLVKRKAALRGGLGRAFAVAPSGRGVLFGQKDGGLALLSTDSRTLGPTFAPGITAVRLAYAPGQAPVAALRLTQQADHAVSFDGGTSVGVTSPIARYRWDFGDGTTAVTAVPTVRHVYRSAGSRTVRLTVTDRVGTTDTPVWGSQMMLRNGGPRATTTRTVTVR